MTLLAADFQKAPDAVSQPVTPLPPLTLGAYACTAEMTETFAVLQRSRLLGRVTMETSQGGLGAAIAACAEAGAPQVLVIESDDDTATLLARLDTLAEHCDPGTRVLVIGGSNDIGLYRALLRQGVSDYLPRPVLPEQLLRSLSEMTTQPGAIAKGAVTACLGSGGGVGSSTIALNTAWVLGQARQGVVGLIDLDLDFGTAGLALALDGSRGIAEALAAGTALDGQMLDGLFDAYDPHLRVLTASEGNGLATEPLPEVLDHLTDLARSGGHRVILDLPGFASATTRRALRDADQVILTTTPDLAGLKNTRKLLDLIAKLRPDEAKPFVVLNRVGMARRQEIAPKDFAQTLGIDIAATVAFNARGFAHANNLGKIYASTPRGKAVRASLQPLVRALVTSQIAAPDTAKPSMASLLSRLLRRG